MDRPEMAARKNTILCVFDMTSPRISALEVHEWVFETLQVNERLVTMLQIDGARRHVYIKFSEQVEVMRILKGMNGTAEYKHSNGVISTVKLEIAGLGVRRVRVANLPPELPHAELRVAIEPYGVIQSITEETWASHYRFVVANGIRVVNMSLSKHLPSHLNIAGYRALISYEGQPRTCYDCGEENHISMECPKRMSRIRRITGPQGHAWNMTPVQANRQEMADRVEMNVTPVLGEITPAESDDEIEEVKTENRTGTEMEERQTNQMENRSVHIEGTAEGEEGMSRTVEGRWADEVLAEKPEARRDQPSNTDTEERSQDWPKLATTVPPRHKTNYNSLEKQELTPIGGMARGLGPGKPNLPADKMQQDSKGDEISRGKKQKMTKSTEYLPERKRTRNKGVVQLKDMP